MSSTFVFSEDFYNRPLFHNGERVTVTENGSFIITHQESRWNRFKCFLTFQQDPNIDKVHEQLKIVLDQVRDQSGPIFSSLKNEVHAYGEKRFKCLEMNLKTLREKLDRVGQLNIFSRTILKLTNVACHIFHKPSVVLKNYANVTFEREEYFAMANYSMILNLSKNVNRSFSVNLYNLQKEALKLTEQDKQTCTFSAESPDDGISEKLQELEKGLKTHILLKQTEENYITPQLGTQQILANLSIIFDSERSQFLATISNPRGNQSISKHFMTYLNRLPNEEKSISYLVRAKNSEGLIQDKKLSLIYDNSEQFQARGEGIFSLILEPNITYEIFSASEELISTFTIRSRLL